MDISNEIQFYTDWVNNEFRLSWWSYYVEDLVEEFCNGCSLVEFVNAVFDEDLPIVHKQPSTFLEREQNVQICLHLLAEENVNLTGVTVRDIARGDVDVILTLCAAIKRRKGVGFRRGGLFGTGTDSHNQDLYQGRMRDTDNLLYSNKNSQMKTLDPTDFLDSGFQSGGLSFQGNKSHGYGNFDERNNFYANQSYANIPSDDSQSECYPCSNDVNKRSSFKGNSEGRNRSQRFQSNSKYNQVSFLLSESQRNKDIDHIVYYDKNDIALFEWVSKVLGVPIKDYGSFADGIVLYRLLCKIIPNCISPKVFYSSQPIQRIQLVLETASHELYFTTNVSATDINKQRNFRSFRVLLFYFKSFYPVLPDTKAHQNTSHSATFTLEELKSVCDIKISDVGSRRLLDNTKPIKPKTDNPKAIVKQSQPTRIDEKQNKVLPKLHEVRSQFVSPTWTKILHEELKMRASRNESRFSNAEPMTSEVRETIEEDDGPSYTRDTERITKYDNEIAAIFEANEDDDEKSDNSEKFDLTVDQKRVKEHTTAMSTPLSSSAKIKNKFLDITSEVRSLSRSPSGSRNA